MRDPEQFLRNAMAVHGDMVYRLALCRTQNPANAEDVYQDVFLRLLNQPEQDWDREHLKAWLLRVAINRAKDISRSFWKKNRLSIEDYADAVPFESREETGLFEAVMRLPEKYREVIHLYYYEDLSIKETARILRITEGSVKMRLSRGRSFLRDVFKEEES